MRIKGLEFRAESRGNIDDYGTPVIALSNNKEGTFGLALGQGPSSEIIVRTAM
jgi:hypothetical protein